MRCVPPSRISRFQLEFLSHELRIRLTFRTQYKSTILKPVLRIRIRIRVRRIHVFGPPDPDPLVIGIDPAPDPDSDPSIANIVRKTLIPTAL
jgi:hypothetical protein